MNNKHTPGPWRATQAYDHSAYTIHQGHDIRMPGSGGATVFSQGCSAEETEANAKLIAAAPELLEALEGLLKTAPVGDISRVGKAEWEANGVIVPNYAKVLAAREAIAKATT